MQPDDSIQQAYLCFSSTGYNVDEEMPCLISKRADDRKYAWYNALRINVLANKFTDAFSFIVERKFTSITMLFDKGIENNSVGCIYSLLSVLTAQ